MTVAASLPVHGVRVLYDLRCPMRDGVNLATDVFLPSGGGQFPVIFFRTPYDSLLELHIQIAVWWTQRGYAVAIQNCRGRFRSEGTFYAYADDGPDGEDALAWIADQPWCNGKIGMSGRSYGGIVQWQTAVRRPPQLTALAPQVIMGDYFGDCHRIGGAVQWALTLAAAVTFSTTVSFVQQGARYIFGNQRFYRHLPLETADEAILGRSIPFYRDWFEHQTDDASWAQINAERQLGNVDVPAYQQAAWYDPYTASMLRAWNRLRMATNTGASQKIYVIPWTHHIPDSSRLGDVDFGPGAYVDLRQEDLRWFDYWLKGIDDGFMQEPPIRIFVMGRNEWRFEHEWPLARTVFTPYYFHNKGSANSLSGNGTLNIDPPGAEVPDQFDYDPQNPVPTLGGNNSTWTMMKFAEDQILPGPVDQRPLERRDDVLVYTSAPLEKEMEVTGPIEVVLYAESSCRDTDFTAKLVDVSPEGPAIHLAEGIIRARHRGGLDRVEFLEPNQVQRYTIELAPTSNVFLAGHRIRVEISSSNFPRFDRNLNTTEDIGRSTNMQVAHQTVLHSSQYPSHILLPVIPDGV